MVGGINYVTIASDASVGIHGHHKGQVGLAYYIRDDSGTYKKAWKLKDRHKGISSTAAELMAMEAALRAVNKRGVIIGSKLIYYCDNKTALDVLTGVNTKVRWSYYISKFKKYLQPFSSVDARWVKAHTDGEEKRHYMNRWADNNAKSMRYTGEYHKGDLRK